MADTDELLPYIGIMLIFMFFSSCLSNKQVITATPRQIESLIRLSEALARIRFSEWVS